MSTGKIIRIAGSVSLVTWLAWQVNFSALASLFHAADLSLLLIAAILAPVFVLLLGLRLHLLLRDSGISLPFVSVWRITWAGQFFNLFLPGSTGGDVFKSIELCRFLPHARARAVTVILADRIFALVSLLGLALVGFHATSLPLQRWLGNGFAISRSALIVAVTGLLLISVLSLLAMRWPRLIVLRIQVVSSLRQIAGYFSGNRTTWVQISAALTVQLLNFIAIYFVARALGIGLTLIQVIGFMPVLMLILLLPVTVNGHGLREFILIAYFQWVGVAGPSAEANPRELAIAFSLGIIALDLWSALPGGIWWFLHNRATSSPARLIK